MATFRSSILVFRMNLTFPKIIKTFYRREPISSFILVVAAVDMVLGGVDGKVSLLSFGFLLAGLAVGVRWLQTNNRKAIPVRQRPRRSLPPSEYRQTYNRSSQGRQPLPPLTHQHRRDRTR